VNWDKLQAVNLNLTAISSFLVVGYLNWNDLLFVLCNCDSFLLFIFLLLLYWSFHMLLQNRDLQVFDAFDHHIFPI
jgi:hypothetical protein